MHIHNKQNLNQSIQTAQLIMADICCVNQNVATLSHSKTGHLPEHCLFTGHKGVAVFRHTPLTKMLLITYMSSHKIHFHTWLYKRWQTKPSVFRSVLFSLNLYIFICIICTSAGKPWYENYNYYIYNWYIYILMLQ